MTRHELKTWPPYFQLVVEGIKRFEIRNDDRQFNVGDILCLKEFEPDRTWAAHPNGVFTGRHIDVKVDYVLRDYHAVKKGFVVMSVSPIEKEYIEQ